MKFQISNFQAYFTNWWMRYLLWNYPQNVKLDLSDDKSTFVQVIGWCCRATSHYLSLISMLAQIYVAIYDMTWSQWVNHGDATARAWINSWIELELIINSIQFSMNWIGIELKDFELELNWNWKPELIGIDQFIFNSTPHFTRLNIFCMPYYGNYSVTSNPM